MVSEGNCLNFPLAPDCGDEVHIKMLDKALSLVNLDKFDVVAVSAGFDTHVGDLASLGLTEKGYEDIGKRIAGLKKRTFFILEGGYQGENVGNDIHQLLKAYESSKVT
jgi:acetoin utilization deacetylase AcuC-like enzyme